MTASCAPRESRQTGQTSALRDCGATKVAICEEEEVGEAEAEAEDEGVPSRGVGL